MAISAAGVLQGPVSSELQSPNQGNFLITVCSRAKHLGTLKVPFTWGNASCFPDWQKEVCVLLPLLTLATPTGGECPSPQKQMRLPGRRKFPAIRGWALQALTIPQSQKKQLSEIMHQKIQWVGISPKNRNGIYTLKYTRLRAFLNPSLPLPNIACAAHSS